ncbi:MAG: cupredoxin domain-containing protein [Pseudoalteromonas spongiae]|uniref:cupredoxin domain-containing protein n=1 Tax=Pseudoalteromonas sp. G4 TaxID=2992761 RepID=UPI00237DE86F|nr:cupredoxin domain-containing protein [Pseudoalteromonas sp. G4]MDE3270797.1 cupredoxin domain-containing protein [Pseudoalteromonas sp. G4]
MKRLIVCLLFCSFSLFAEREVFHLTLKDHVFYPELLEIPANKKIKLVITNLDDSDEEFDSFDMNREKVIFAKRKATIFVGPLPPGEYEFFGEFHPDTARGKVIAKEPKNAD